MACCCCSGDWMRPCCMPATPPRTDDWMWRSMMELCGKDERDLWKKSACKSGCEEVIPCVQPNVPPKCPCQQRQPACNPLGGAPILEPRRVQIPFVDFKHCEAFVFLDGKHTLYTQPAKVVKPETKCIDPAKADLRVYAEHQEIEIKPKEQEYEWYRKHKVGPLIVYTPVDTCVLPQQIECPEEQDYRTEHLLLIKRPKGVSPTTFQGLFEPNPSSTAKFVPARQQKKP